MSAATLTERLLAELIRQREEAAGHPPYTPEADAAARGAGGSLAQRIVTRASALPEAPALRLALLRSLRSVRLVAFVLLLFSVLSGIAATSAALAATTPASLPLVLVALVGANLLTLLLWLLLQLGFARLAPGLAAHLRDAWRWLALRMSRRGPGGFEADAHSSAQAMGEAMSLLAGGRIGRWLLAALAHGAWLSFSLSALATLAVLLSVRAYELSWATTLLSADTVAHVAHLLSTVPAAFGVPLDGLHADAIVSASDRQHWSQWLLAAVFGYAVVPRVFALMVCLLLLLRALAALTPDPRRPGYARLRQRLMPEHRALGVIDAAPATDHAKAESLPPSPANWPQGRVHAGWIDGRSAAPPAPAGVEWIWLGNADDAATRAAQLEALREEAAQALVVLVRATMSPDRGVERHLTALHAAAEAPTFLVLTGYSQLHARGTLECEQRLIDWRALAARAQAQVLTWDPPAESS